ncbi:glutathione peroxidase [Sulfurimonas sp. MAG313]|nr:glutathione peroxidase [Sulfurimonas sp. MAG313]MDF1882161.1 glutathione peroxidase [Sulfurimonas sp. MAG313]
MKKIYLTLILSISLYAQSFYDFNALSIKGKEISMSTYKGKVVLVVNTASECQFTPQYEGLQELYSKYKDKGLVVLGFPSNQFRKQEPASNKEIHFFCTSTYQVDFPMFAKIDVNGDNALPLYKYLKKEKTGFLWTKSIKWNFTKFLVDQKGKVLKRYGSSTEPKEIESDILKLLRH